MSDTLTVTITGPPGEVERILRRFGGGEQALTVKRASAPVEAAPAQNHTEVIPEPGQNQTKPSPAKPRAEKPKQKAATAPAGPSAADLELLAALNGDLRPAVDIAVQLGIKRTSCGGVARKLDRLVDEGRVERVELPDGKRGYRLIGATTPLPEPTEESDQTPTPPVALPPRAPSLHLGDLIGHSVRVAWSLNDHGPQTRHELATRLELPDEDVRDTLHLLIRQGYVRRETGNVVRYALTADVVREGAGEA